MLRIFIVNILLRMLSWLPLSVAHMFGRLFGRILNSFFNELSRTTRTNINLCFPELTKSEKEALALQALMQTGMSGLECGALWLWPPEKILGLICEVTGWQLLEKAVADGRGVILAVPHLGSWEALGIHITSRYPLTGLYRPQRNTLLGDKITAARQRAGGKFVPIGTGGIRALYKALGRGELVHIMPDQEPARNAGVFAPFFGIEANTMTLLSRMARKSGAPVLICYAERLPKGRGYHIYISQGPDCLSDADALKAAACLNQTIEEHVRKFPAQYQWAYRRFKTRPEGEAGLYVRIPLKKIFDK